MVARAVFGLLFVLFLWCPGLGNAASFDCKSVAEQSPSSVAPQPIQIQGAESFVYEQIGDASLRLHVFSPLYRRPSDRSAAIVFFFGGGRVFGTVKQFVPQVQYLAQRGMADSTAGTARFGGSCSVIKRNAG
jgi:hypothetical protein